MADDQREVTHCERCPALNTAWEGDDTSGGYDYECNLGAIVPNVPNAQWPRGHRPPTPADCPLRKGPVTLRLAEKR